MDWPKFYGHSVWAYYGNSIVPFGLIPDIILALLPLIFYVLMRYYVMKSGSFNLFMTIVFGTAFILYLPNTTYLGLEGKHLFLDDGVAENPDKFAWLSFAALSVLGIYLNVITILVATKKKNPMILLCFLSVLGATMGLNALNSYDAVLHPFRTLGTVLQIFIDPKSLVFMIGMFVSLCFLMRASVFILNFRRQNKSLL